MKWAIKTGSTSSINKSKWGYIFFASLTQKYLHKNSFLSKYSVRVGVKLMQRKQDLMEDKRLTLDSDLWFPSNKEVRSCTSSCSSREKSNPEVTPRIGLLKSLDMTWVVYFIYSYLSFSEREKSKRKESFLLGRLLWKELNEKKEKKKLDKIEQQKKVS